MRTRRRGLRPMLDELADRCLLSGSTGLTPAEVAGAYGLAGLTFTAGSGAKVAADGSGVTIALIEMYHDPNLVSDLHVFDQAYGLPDPTLNVIDQAGNQTDSGWGQEESLDVEWAHAIAPGASILVVEAAPGYTGTQGLQSLLSAVQVASTPSSTTGLKIPPVAVVSMSWGFSEFPGETTYDPTFTTPGITYIAASGDTPGAEYPAASPDVLSVGGTTLHLGALGGYGSESAWYDSGGGYSQFESEPAYQQSVQSSGRRSTPDVAFVGDPNTGVSVYFTPAAASWQSSSPVGSWSTVGGTSLGAPSWAGIIAMVDQGRAIAGRGSLGGATQAVPSLYTLAAGASTSGDFHSVTSTSPGAPWGGYGGFWWGGSPTATGTSSPGMTANTQTGLGTPNGPGLINNLVGSTLTAPLPTPSPIPVPTPTPTPPSPSPAPTTPIGPSHHRHKASHRVVRAHGHPVARHHGRIVRQGTPKDRPHLGGNRPGQVG